MRLMEYDGLVPAAQVINVSAKGELVRPPPEQRTAQPKLETINLTEFVTQPLPQRQYVLAPILPERGLAMLYAPRGVGKTQVAFNIGWTVAYGQPFLQWYAPKARPVLYVDGEMPQELLQERAKAMIAPSACQPPHPDFFRLLSMDRQGLGTSLNLALPITKQQLRRCSIRWIS